MEFEVEFGVAVLAQARYLGFELIDSVPQPRYLGGECPFSW
jgi:hypothetical protein